MQPDNDEPGPEPGLEPRPEPRPNEIILGPGLTLHGDPAPFFEAFAKAQDDYKDLERSRTVKVDLKSGGSYSFDYAPLENILDATLPALRKQGFSFSQPLSTAGTERVLHTILGHESGTFLHAETTIPDTKDLQKLGSAMTYLRRYEAQSVLGVSAEYDDDGAKASGHQSIPQGSRSRNQDKQRYEFHPDDELTVAQKENLEDQGWRSEDDEPHYWGYFEPGSVDEAMLEKFGTVKQSGGGD